MLIIFDNATTHQAHAKDALSALRMPLQSKLWVPKSQSCQMQDGTFKNGEPQALYYPDDDPDRLGHFKGMAVILEERGFDIRGLRAQCKVSFANCDDPSSTGQCCCHRILYNEPDFAQQKGSLQELIENEGHICDFYPKFHPELNFIEQYLGGRKVCLSIIPTIFKDRWYGTEYNQCIGWRPTAAHPQVSSSSPTSKITSMPHYFPL